MQEEESQQFSQDKVSFKLQINVYILLGALWHKPLFGTKWKRQFVMTLVIDKNLAKVFQILFHRAVRVLEYSLKIRFTCNATRDHGIS